MATKILAKSKKWHLRKWLPKFGRQMNQPMVLQIIVTPQGIEKVTIQLKDTPTKVYAIGAKLFLSKVPLEMLQNRVLIQSKDTPHILKKCTGSNKRAVPNNRTVSCNWNRRVVLRNS